MTNDEHGSSSVELWKDYPFRIGEDPRLVFPAAEGDQGAESNSYCVTGRLRGRETGREWAFLALFAANDVAHRVRADLYTLAFFDLESGEYGTYSELDLPRPFTWRKEPRVSIARNRLDVAFRSLYGTCVWKGRETAEGGLVPFEYHLSLVGKDRSGRILRLSLDLDARKPPFPTSGEPAGGRLTCLGQPGSYSYFQSAVRFAGTLRWGEVEDVVDGDSGWIDRVWAPRSFCLHNGRRATRYRHEWRQIHLDNGVEIGAWHQYDRLHGNRLIPFSGITAAFPDDRLSSTTECRLERLSFVRDPRIVRPRYPLNRSAKYLTDRYRLIVPAWELDVVSEPLVPAPAHELPIEYWNGPTRIQGTMGTRTVSGLGFHERTQVFTEDFELVEVLRGTLRQLPDDPFRTEGQSPVEIADRVWEIDAFLSRGAREAALRYLGEEIRPELERLPEPHRESVLRMADDLRDALFRWWVRG